MIIAHDALSLQFGASDRAAPEERPRNRPVGSLARLRATLSDTFPQHVADERADSSDAESEPTTGRRQKDDAERRREDHGQDERRKTNSPILLDPRVTRSRREEIGDEPYPVINVEA